MSVIIPTGQQIETTNPDGTDLRQVINVGDPTATTIAKVETTDPASTDAGLVVRDVRGNATTPVRVDPTGTTSQPVTLHDGSGNSITSTSNALDVNVKSGATNTQYVDGATQATPTGTVALGKNPSNVLHSLALDASGNLNVALQNTPTVSVGNTVSVSQSGTWTAATNADTTSGGTTAPSKILTVGGKTSDVTPQYQPLPLTNSGAAVKVDGSATTQPVSGTVSVNALPTGSNVIGSVKVTDGTNFQPTGDSSARSVHTTVDNSTLAVTQSGTWTDTTNADTTIGGTTAPSKMLTVGGKTSDGTPQYQPVPLSNGGAAVKVDGSATTQPVSGTVTINPVPTGSNTIGNVKVTDGTNFMPTGDTSGRSIHVTPDSLPALAIGSNIIGKVDLLGNAGVALDAAQNAAAPANELVVGGVYNSSPPTITSGNASQLQVDTSGNLKVNVITGGGSGSNAAASATGSAVPASADYDGVNVGGTLRGVTGVNPTGSVYAPQTDLASANGVSLGSPTAYGTAPSGNVIGVNASVTNTVNVKGVADMTGTTPGTAPSNTTVVGGIYNSTPPAPSTGQTLPLQTSSSGALIVQGFQPATVAFTGITATGTQTAQSCVGYNVCTLTLRTFTGTTPSVTWSLQASDDNTNWVTLQGINNNTGQVATSWTQASALTAGTAGPSIDYTIGAYTNIRINVTAISGTTPTAAFGMSFQTMPYESSPGALCQGLVASGSAAVGNPVLGGGVYNSSAPTLTNGNAGSLQLDSAANLRMTQIPTTANGLTIKRLLSAASTNATSVKVSAGQVYSWSIYNTTASTVRFVKLYNKASAPTVGTDTPVITLLIPPGGGTNFSDHNGIAFATGIAFAITGAVADSDATVVAANDIILNLFYV